MRHSLPDTGRPPRGKGPSPARDRIYAELKRRLQSHEFGARAALPSLRELGREFNTSVGPVRQALDLLRYDGQIYSEHGRGNFAVRAPPGIRNAMLITRLSGHLFSEFVSEFGRLFSTHPGCQLLYEETPAWEDPDGLARLQAKIDGALRRRALDAIVFSDPPGPLASLLARYEHTVSLHCFLSQPEACPFTRCASVLTDFRYGGAAGVRHLHEAGCRHVLVVTHRTDIYGPRSAVRQFLAGCEREAAALPLGLLKLEHQAEDPDYADVLAACLTRHPELDGVFALGDFRLAPLYPVLAGLGRRVGVDIALLGYFDTPIATALYPTLSSVTLHPRAMVERVCAQCFGPAASAEALQIVPPDVVARASSRLGAGLSR